MAALLARSTAIGLPGPEPAETPATTVAELFAASSSATGTSTWSSRSALPSCGAVCGVTITASVAGVDGCPLVVRNPALAYARSMVCALVSCWLPADAGARLAAVPPAPTWVGSRWRSPARPAAGRSSPVFSTMSSACGMARVIWFRPSSVVSLVSKNLGCSAICPVTVAPASWVAALLIAVTTEAGAPGSVTISSRWPASRSCSTTGSTAWA